MRTALKLFQIQLHQIHRTLRMSPAMAAGVTDRLWDMNDLLGPLGSLRTDGGKSSTMIFVKSAMAGIAAVFLSCLVLFVCVVGYLSLASKPYSGPVQWDPV